MPRTPTNSRAAIAVSPWHILSFVYCARAALSDDALFHDVSPAVSTVTATTTINIKYYNDLVASLPSLHGKCVAITGTTSGLGYWAAVATAKKGASCLMMLNRNSNRSVAAEEAVKKQAAPGVAVITVTCDLENISSVREAATNVNRIAAKYDGLDVLALNAGIMNQPDKRTHDGFDVTMQTNHLGHFLLTKLLMPSLHAAAAKGKEIRIVTHSSMARGTSSMTLGGGPMNVNYYQKSQPGSLGGDKEAAERERYHQSKLANIAFAMALHAKFAALPRYSNFKALSAAPGFSETGLNIPRWLREQWLQNLIALSAPDGSCSILTAMFAPSAQSGDFYEPKDLAYGPPIKVISQGVPLPPDLRRKLVGIRDDEVCANATLVNVWNFSEIGLREKFIIGEVGMPQSNALSNDITVIV
eukprot:gnl/MRDRNA2_/MRDRNA2_105016_c0_seq1.p1 gnl/MRDRNA2_/MRDRNA2_105016_c0~~gnl/MRDRNA2_/MRDRNA2_105016_c0_seq1.p1  ORF type:complete len:415 (-),score=49.28 gnl/MRDRNA2_/MRDRNA2_105016_c0_seq1:494-1738(-)